MSKTRFLVEFLRHPLSVGALAPSGDALVNEMINSFDWQSATGVLEYGPGTGVFTAAIQQQLRPDAQFLAIERSAEMVSMVRKRCPDATVVHDDVTRVAQLCRDHEIDSVDAIVCGLPWAAFSASLQDEIMRTMMQVLKPGGVFCSFAYLQGLPLPAGRRFAARLDRTFSNVRRSRIVWKNLPPAIIYRCVR